MATIKPRIIRINNIRHSTNVAEHFNAIAAKEKHLPDGEFVFWGPETHRFLVAVPCGSIVPAQLAMEDFHTLRLLIDRKIDIKLSDYPRLINRDGKNRDKIRGFPVFVPASLFGPDFPANVHEFELQCEGVRIFGPMRILVGDETMGSIFENIESGPGPRQLTFTVRKTEQQLQVAIVRTDVTFGKVASAEQVLPDGAVVPLVYIRDDVHGLPVLHHLGDTPLLYEGFVTGFRGHPFVADTIFRLTFEEVGVGFCMANRGGITLEGACRADVIVRD